MKTYTLRGLLTFLMLVAAGLPLRAAAIATYSAVEFSSSAARYQDAASAAAAHAPPDPGLAWHAAAAIYGTDGAVLLQNTPDAADWP